MAQSITVERAGQRVYAVNTPFAAKDRLKEIGCKWDPDRRAWWIGLAKSQTLEALVAELNGPAACVAASVGLRADTPAGIVADALTDAGRDGEAARVASMASAPPVPKAKEDPDNVRLTGKGTYKGRTYYIGSSTRDGARVRLLTLPDAKGDYLDFWADVREVQVVKTYAPREVWDGRRYSGRTRTEYTTLGSIAKFIERQQDPERRRGPCVECGTWGPAGQTCRDCNEGTHASGGAR